ncbi:MAG: hypothetical protein EXR77_15675 [Myxococcales bacterium]|nr:hypothetical protein [Myxococcales bacterium]
MAAQLALTLQPAAQQHEAEERLTQVAQAGALVDCGITVIITKSLQIDPFLQQASIGAPLTALELAVVSAVAQNCAKLRRNCRQWPASVHELASLCHTVPDLQLLGEVLAESIDDQGHILDTASAELARLRRETVVIASRLRRRIEALVRESDAAGLLQDDYFTLRDDRYVLPVRHSEKRTLPGIIHGTSQTGQTVYVEPQELVEANNQLALAFDAVRREERRILAELSELCAESAPNLRTGAQVLATVDLRLATAALARDQRANRPRFCEDRLDLPGLRHPILELDGAHPVANRLAMATPQSRWFVISGPNGGGKTVLLTALGLAAEMARRGMFVTASADATMPWFDAVHSVIGDAQDLDLGLSTFEGHLRATADVLQQCAETPRALALFDELATGTEPLAASALATAILESAAAQSTQTWGAATTHFETCKLLALRDPAFVNAALGRDNRTGAPTYVLQLGQIGASDPLGLAQRVGLPSLLIERAHQLMGSAGSQLQAMLATLATQSAGLDDERDQLRHQQAQLDHARVLLDDQRHNEKRASDRRIERASAEAMARLEALTKDIEQLRQGLAQADRAQLHQALDQKSRLKVEIDTIAAQVKPSLPNSPQRKPLPAGALRPGEPAFHVGLQRPVTIVEIDAHGDRAKVSAGGLQLWSDITQLQSPVAADAPMPSMRRRDTGKFAKQSAGTHAAAPSAMAQPQTMDELSLVARTAEMTVDVRGVRVDEALDAVDAHLDKCVLAGGVGAFVIHGQGTGALKQAIREHLKSHRQVAQFRKGEQREGGDGVTLIWLAS